MSDALDPLDRAERVGIALVGAAGRLAAGVDHHRSIGRHAGLVELVERGVVGGEALHVAMELHPGQAQRERLFEDRARARLARQHGGEAGDAGLVAADLGHVGVERARHARLVGVGQRDHARDAAGEEEREHLGRVEGVADRPAVGLEPPMNRVEDPIGEEVHVGVDHLGQRFGEPLPLGVVGGREGEHRRLARQGVGETGSDAVAHRPRSVSTACAALCPAAPITEPAGWVPALAE